ncbi:hypothetical protein B484DRAFT_399889 [Ochromonadaceae sp. CCMP2298]|nr:hypothetical protein B484DRAFT_399889 [Ochromonadaceae sp. CCMP2298]
MLLGLQGQNAAGGSGGSTFPQASVAGLSSGSSSGSAFAQRLLVSGAGQALANMHVSSQSSSTAMQEDDDFDLTRWISKKNQKVSALKTQITQLGVEREALRVENQQLRVDNHVENQQLRVENQQQQMRIQELEAQQLQDKQQYEAQQLQDRQQYKEDIKKASLRNDELDSRRRLKVSELETHVEELTATVAALQAEQTDIDELQAMMKKISNKRARGGETSGSSSRGIDDDGWQNV